MNIIKPASHLSRSFSMTGILSHRAWRWKRLPLVAAKTRNTAAVTTKRLTICTTSICPSLISSIATPTLSNIRVLPEVSQALDSQRPDGTVVSGLKRAADVFQQLSMNSKCQEEFKAVLMLQAQIYMDLNQYENALQVLDSLTKIDSLTLTQEEVFDVSIAMVRMHFYNGSLEHAMRVAKEMCDLAPQLSQHDHVALRQGTALNALGVSKLAAVHLHDVELEKVCKDKPRNDKHTINHDEMRKQAQEATYLLKMASKLLETKYREDKRRPLLSEESSSHLSPLGLACAASYSNQGVGELITSLIRSQCVDTYRTVPIDSAMIAWRSALNILEEMERDCFLDDEKSHSAEKASVIEKRMRFLKGTKARVYCNMAWGLLFSSEYIVQKEKSKSYGLKEDSLKLASEYAGNALKIFNTSPDKNEDIGRCLNMVASCYARAGSAVTTEGLLKSAMDIFKDSTNPLRVIDARSTFLYYSKLCSNWEKRQADATKYAHMAMDLDQSPCLPEVWRNQSSILSGVYMFSKDEL